MQYSEQPHPQLQPVDHTSQASYVSSNSDQPPTMIDMLATGQAFISPDSPTPPQASSEGGMGNAEEVEAEMETTSFDPEVGGSNVNTPKKRAMRLARAETQHSDGQTGVLRQIPIPDIWKPDLPSGLALNFSSDANKITGVRAERMIQKGAKFGPFNGKLLDEYEGSVKDSTWEVGIFSVIFMTLKVV